MIITSDTNISDWKWLYTMWRMDVKRYSIEEIHDASKMMLSEYGVKTEMERCMMGCRTFEIVDMTKFMIKKLER